MPIAPAPPAIPPKGGPFYHRVRGGSRSGRPTDTERRPPRKTISRYEMSGSPARSIGLGRPQFFRRRRIFFLDLDFGSVIVRNTMSRASRRLTARGRTLIHEKPRRDFTRPSASGSGRGNERRTGRGTD